MAGLYLIASGQALIALREIALNTRQGTKPASATSYAGLRVLGGILVVFGAIAIAGTLILGISIVLESQS